MLSDTERHELLTLARRMIAARLTGSRPPTLPVGIDQRAGAFVTLTVGGDLRGCIGYPRGDRRLPDVVAECAVAAAMEDPRFPPLTPEELEGAEVEISVLGPVEPVADTTEIEVGRHGLIVEQGMWRGLLLPQVATEHGWDRETFLSHTCLKAGLPSGAWRSGARIFKFEAEVFSEESVPM